MDTKKVEIINTFANYSTDCAVFWSIPLHFSFNMDWGIIKLFTLNELKVPIQNTPHNLPDNDRILLRVIQCCDNMGLCSLLNCVKAVFFPLSWRELVVIPILKPRKDYWLLLFNRPIVLTPLLCKSFERMLLWQLIPWFFQNGQSFRSQSLWVYPFPEIHGSVEKSVCWPSGSWDKKFHTILVSLDIVSAYDSIWPDSFTCKMLDVGLNGRFES